MVYYNDNELMIRNMEEADARVFTDEEIAPLFKAALSVDNIALPKSFHDILER